MKIQKNNIDLGILGFGVTKLFTFNLTNDLKDSIEIDSVIASCHSCTDVTFSNKVLDPGSSCIIYVAFTPGVTGKHNKKVVVSYHNRETNEIYPALELKFKAVVI